MVLYDRERHPRTNKMKIMSQVASPFFCHLGTEVLALAHAFAHVVLSSSSFFPLPMQACVFTRRWSVGPLVESGSVVCTTLWQAGSM